MKTGGPRATAMAAGFMPSRHQALEAWIVDRQDPAAMAVLTAPGDLPPWTRNWLLSVRWGPGPRQASSPGRDTPVKVPGIRCPGRQGGRGLSHPQDGPLSTAGAAELQPGPGPCGQLRSRTANRMAVP